MNYWPDRYQKDIDKELYYTVQENPHNQLEIGVVHTYDNAEDPIYIVSEDELDNLIEMGEIQDIYDTEGVKNYLVKIGVIDYNDQLQLNESIMKNNFKMISKYSQIKFDSPISNLPLSRLMEAKCL